MEEEINDNEFSSSLEVDRFISDLNKLNKDKDGIFPSPLEVYRFISRNPQEYY